MHPAVPRSAVLRSAARFVLASAIALVAAACGEDRACYEGDFQSCTCEEGKAGFAACDVANDAYGACGYCGTVPGSAAAAGGTGGTGGAGGSGGGGSGGGALLGFLETCSKDEECETKLCYTFNAKGPKCTTHCQTDGECPAPSPGCNNMGVCKAP